MGTLNIVGIGPGNDLHITPAALAAIKEADHVIGYTTYIRLIKKHIEGKTITRTGMSEEIGRARTAIEMAREGKNITLVSSGDAGVYGMAGLVFDVLKSMGWKKGDEPQLSIIPGISAANSCGSLVGAPLIHDACTISLSDLLTPWPVIEKRIEAAAMGDFVISFYNPASGRRQRQIVEAYKILSKYREGTTPVALVKSGYRAAQNIILTDLDHFLDYEIGMLTTVIVGSTQTYVYEGYMVTPRGYVNKYEIKDGQVKSGQRKTFSLRCEGDLSEKCDGEKRAKTYSTPTENWVTPKDVNDTQFLKDESSNEQKAKEAIELLAKTGLIEKIDCKGDQVSAPSFNQGMHLISHFYGALLFRDEKKSFLIGEFKSPVDLNSYGIKIIEDLKEQAIKEIAIEENSQLPNPAYHFSAEGITAAQKIYQRLAIYRNHSISRRVCAYLEEHSKKILINGIEVFDVNWLLTIDEMEWNKVRDELLRCS